MVTVRVTHHLDRDEVKAVLCHLAPMRVTYPDVEEDGKYDDHEPLHWSAAKVDREVRAYLLYRGLGSAEYWGDSLTDEEIERTEDWADETLTRIGWPANL